MLLPTNFNPQRGSAVVSSPAVRPGLVEDSHFRGYDIWNAQASTPTERKEDYKKEDDDAAGSDTSSLVPRTSSMSDTV